VGIRLGANRATAALQLQRWSFNTLEYFLRQKKFLLRKRTRRTSLTQLANEGLDPGFR
jgi:hypothetical protein